ncbi:hypothetical protein AAG570_005459 [Ranatra chinensis]|uniref:Uncharacterized protein n=1 Tax=Ranatra chinensis TaxID=642074 RepID=A0ABD0YJ84_9HEMI
MASKRRNMFHKNKTQETTEEAVLIEPELNQHYPLLKKAASKTLVNVSRAVLGHEAFPLFHKFWPGNIDARNTGSTTSEETSTAAYASRPQKVRSGRRTTNVCRNGEMGNRKTDGLRRSVGHFVCESAVASSAGMCGRHYSSRHYEEHFWSEVLSEANFRLRRSSSALAIRPSSHPRPPSSLSLREGGRRFPKRKTSPESVPVDGLELEKFRRSLRLVGLRLQDLSNCQLLGQASGDDQLTNTNKRPDVRGVKPKVRTRLVRRSVSAEELRTVILLEDPSNARVTSTSASPPSSVWAEGRSPRNLLATAVYEEWYFKKMEEARKTKEMALREEKARQWSMENVGLIKGVLLVNGLSFEGLLRSPPMRLAAGRLLLTYISAKRQKSEKNKECYLEWMNRKCAQKKDKEEPVKGEGGAKETPASGPAVENRVGAPTAPGVAKRTKVRQKDVDEATTAFLLWKKEKDKLLKKKQQEEEMKRRREIDKEKKREESLKAFLAWKKKTDEELKEKARRKEEEEEKKRENEMRMQEERCRDAEAVFSRWKQNKDTHLRDTLKRHRVERCRLKTGLVLVVPPILEGAKTLEKSAPLFRSTGSPAHSVVSGVGRSAGVCVSKVARCSLQTVMMWDLNSTTDDGDSLTTYFLHTYRTREQEEMRKLEKEENSRIRRYEANQAFLEWLDRVEERRMATSVRRATSRPTSLS